MLKKLFSWFDRLPMWAASTIIIAPVVVLIAVLLFWASDEDKKYAEACQAIGGQTRTTSSVSTGVGTGVNGQGKVTTGVVTGVSSDTICIDTETHQQIYP